MKSEIPDGSDWGNWQDDMDLSYAHSVYYGRSNEELEEYFVFAPIEAAGELAFMPAPVFRYYVIGFRDSVMSGKHEEFNAANAASCFIRLILDRAKSNPSEIVRLMPDLWPTLEYIAGRQAAFDADVDIYGDFLAIVQNIKDACSG